ncbi:hypothetical protein E4U41_006784 [Claviceps citrina]|nr:hypothetical protein E4U41_006784 [Claviceps citrina]
MFKPNSNNRSREPPPTLFLHPSAGASNVSLTGATAPTAFIAGQTHTVLREQSTLERSTSTSLRRGFNVTPDLHRNVQAGSCRSPDKTDALWAQMQATLEEVELSASGGTHVFGPGQSQRLSDLRSAQIGLAQAWARSETDDVGIMGMRGRIEFSDGGNVRNTSPDLANLNVVNGPGRVRRIPEEVIEIQNDRLLSDLGMEEKSEIDILLGRKRRDANDKYFQRVNKGVIDVVAKLKDVTVAMHGVDREDQDIWNEVDEEPR